MRDGKTKTKLTLAVGTAAITAFAHKLEDTSASYTWAALLEEEDGSYSLIERLSNPCYGEMRPYAQGPAGNGPYIKDLLPISQRVVCKPGDLYWPFPKTGKPILLAVPFGKHTSEDWDKMMTEIVLNPEVSPWRAVLKDFEIVRHPTTNIASGLIIKDTKVDPTVMVNMFRKIKNDINVERYMSVRKKYPDLTPLEAFVFSQVYRGDIVINQEYGSVFGMNYDIKRIITGVPIDQTDGGTFYERYAYNRPKVDWIFNSGENIFPSMFKTGWGEKNDEKVVLQKFIELARA